MSFSDLPFSDLRRLLLDLGFEERTIPPTSEVPVPGIAFRHAASDSFLAFRAYRPRDKVSALDIIGVRKQLDLQGLLSAEAFDASLRKASA